MTKRFSSETTDSLPFCFFSEEEEEEDEEDDDDEEFLELFSLVNREIIGTSSTFKLTVTVLFCCDSGECNDGGGGGFCLSRSSDPKIASDFVSISFDFFIPSMNTRSLVADFKIDADNCAAGALTEHVCCSKDDGDSTSSRIVSLKKTSSRESGSTQSSPSEQDERVNLNSQPSSVQSESPSLTPPAPSSMFESSSGGRANSRSKNGLSSLSSATSSSSVSVTEVTMVVVPVDSPAE